jgi:hypothetical protein
VQEYEVAVQAFEEAHREYERLENALLSGDWLDDCFSGSTSKDQMKDTYLDYVHRVRDALEERNRRRKAAADALRQKVVLTATKWRGPEGKATLLNVGPFKVSSVTKRGFDQKSLFDLCQKHGVLERLLDLKTMDKDGKEKPLVKLEYDINYEGVLSWLKANQMQDVIDGAYDENESTPQVKGPKELSFLGEAKEK